jgi:type III secretory pathway component EscV
MNVFTSSLSHGRRADLLLAALVVAIVGMMIVPLPTALIDLCIALNLTLGILLLATALYLRDPLSFAAFPTLLLLSTLYRLALNVSSTRLILLQADAGRVIEAFGSFVVRGDYVVGALVFALLTLVQFIVIARGAERVAEVGARFSLDALPGKQLAIDADLRAGQLSPEGAQRERRKLERESQLYGAMDGAMKFVKGDAVAGIVITLVNVLGGVSLGVLSRGLDLSQSLKLYGLLTIGDGIVTQIPALLSATSAGLVVTRVASAEEDGSLGSEIGRQLFGDVRVLSVGALLLFALALVPHMPTLPFLLAAAGCLGLALRADRRAPARRREPLERSQDRLEALTLTLSPALAAALGGTESTELREALEQVEQALRRKLGISLPRPLLRTDDALPARSFRLHWRELPEETEVVPEGAAIAPHLAEALRALAERRAEDCLDLEEVQRLLGALERDKPALVRLMIPRMISLSLLSEVLRGLVREGVSVRWLPEILETIAPRAQRGEPSELLVEAARRGLARRITRNLCQGSPLAVLRLSPMLEETLADAVRRDDSREWLALPAALADEICTDVAQARASSQARALLTQASLRRHVRTLLQDSAPDLAVICPEELLPSAELAFKATVGP